MERGMVARVEWMVWQHKQCQSVSKSKSKSKIEAVVARDQPSVRWEDRVLECVRDRIRVK